jgi:prephenate dehydrogenase
MTTQKEKLIRSIVAGIFTVGGFILVASQNWQIAVGLFLAMWGNNHTERNNFKDEYGIEKLDE